jgi:hypothetical protein
MMTVAELIESLKALPPDMKIQVMTSEGDGPSDIVQVSRGSWGGDAAEDDFDAIIDPDDLTFDQDDENGQIAVLVTW